MTKKEKMIADARRADRLAVMKATRDFEKALEVAGKDFMDRVRSGDPTAVEVSEVAEVKAMAEYEAAMDAANRAFDAAMKKARES